MRLNKVAPAIAPDDFNICDTGGFSRKDAKAQRKLLRVFAAWREVNRPLATGNRQFIMPA
jgi:hypothetical protein